MMNLIIIILILFGLGISLYFFFVSRKYYRETVEREDPQKYTIPGLIEYVKDCINEITRTNLFELGLSEVEFKKQTNQRAELKKALKVCMHGSIVDKQFVKAFIYDILHAYIPNEKTNSIIPFNNPYLLSTKDKFAILIYMTKKEHGANALSYLIDTFQLDRLKKNENGEYSYYISKQEINDIYNRMDLILTGEDKLEIITQTVYEQYKGLGVIDEIRDMNIDGVSAGVSGVPEDFIEFSDFREHINGVNRHEKNYESIWLFYKGKSIKLDFIGFESESELKSLSDNIPLQSGGQLSRLPATESTR